MKNSFLFSLVIFISIGCATTDPKWKFLEDSLSDLKIQRAEARNLLTENPKADNAPDLTLKINKLNEEVKNIERSLSYAQTTPVSSDPFNEKYHGPIPSSHKKIVRIKSEVFGSLSSEEREKLNQKYTIKFLQANDYGNIIEAQTLNESTAGSSAGSELGSYLGQINYINKSFSKGNNYSTSGQIVSGVAGAFIGSVLDKAPENWYRTRYFIKANSGKIISVDQNRSDGFRMPLSYCVELPTLNDEDQSICSQTEEEVRNKYLSKN